MLFLLQSTVMNALEQLGDVKMKKQDEFIEMVTKVYGRMLTLEGQKSKAPRFAKSVA